MAFTTTKVASPILKRHCAAAATAYTIVVEVTRACLGSINVLIWFYLVQPNKRMSKAQRLVFRALCFRAVRYFGGNFSLLARLREPLDSPTFTLRAYAATSKARPAKDRCVDNCAGASYKVKAAYHSSVLKPHSDQEASIS